MRLHRAQRRTTRPVAELQAADSAWARELWAKTPATVAALIQVGRSAHNRKTVNHQQARVQAAMDRISAIIGAGDPAGARAVVVALIGQGVDWLHWCDDEAALAEVLAECLQFGECCYDECVLEGGAGAVVWAAIWHDPSHPV